MTRYYLKNISIEGFRGINNKKAPLEINFKPAAVNSIHAPNGFGKTSIFEAINFAIFNEVPRLSEFQAGERPNDYINNLFHKEGATIELTFTPDDNSKDIQICIHRTVAGHRSVESSSGHPDPDGFLRSLQEDFVLVDYKKFAKFIDNSALERGRSFAPLVSLSSYSFQKQAFDSVKDTRSLNSDFGIGALEAEIRNLEGQLNECTRKVCEVYTKITGETEQNGFDLENLCLRVTKVFVDKDPLKSYLGSSGIIGADLEKAKKELEEVEEGGPLRTQHTLLLDKIKTIKELAPYSNEKSNIENLLKLAAEYDDALLQIGSALMRQLYNTASTVVQDASWTDPHLCPVCDSKSAYNIIDHVASKLETYQQAEEAGNRLKIAVLESAVLERLNKLETSNHFSVPINQRLYSIIVQDASDYKLSALKLQNVFSSLGTHDLKRESLLCQALDDLKGIEERLPESLVTMVNLITAACYFQEKVRDYNDIDLKLSYARRRLNLINQWKVFIGQAADIFSKAEAQMAAKKIEELKPQYQELFKHLVRGGRDMQPTLERSSKKGNLELLLDNFYGLSSINARAVLSESYRNAIAASIFLTAAISHKGKPRFMILDDITSSFDSGHQVSLLEAIRIHLQQPKNPDGLQFIILSHDNVLGKYFDINVSNSIPWRHQTLQGTSPKGQVMVSAHDSDRLRSLALTHLDSGDVVSGAPLIRQYLEFKLGKIISDLNILVPPDYAIRGDSRTLSTYLNSIVGAVELFQKANVCVLTSEQIEDITKRHAITLLTNFVSHYETSGGTPFTPDVLRGVLLDIDALVDCFTYQDDRTVPSEKKFYKRLDKR